MPRVATKEDELVAGNMVILPVEDIKFDPDKNGRNGYPNLASLKESIAEYGILQPVRIDTEGNLMAGFSRVKAMLDLKEASTEVIGGHLVPALVEEAGLTDTEHLVRNLQTNVINPLTPMDVYGNISRLQEMGITDMEQLQKIFHRSRAWVEMHQQLGTQLNAKMQRKVASGEIPISVAQKMVDLPKGDQEAFYEQVKAAGGGTATRDAVSAARREKDESEGGKSYARTGAAVKKFWEGLKEKLEESPDFYGTEKADLKLSESLRSLCTLNLKFISGSIKTDSNMEKKLISLLKGEA